jgi:hypothetical protein
LGERLLPIVGVDDQHRLSRLAERHTKIGNKRRLPRAAFECGNTYDGRLLMGERWFHNLVNDSPFGRAVDEVGNRGCQLTGPRSSLPKGVC